MKAALVAISCAGCASPPAVAPVTPIASPSRSPIAPVHSDPALAPRLAELDTFLQGEMARRGFPGLAAAVVTREGVVWSKAYGVRDLRTETAMTLDTRFRLGSITKVFTALAVLQLRDAGKLDLDAPVSRWIPELAAVVPVTQDSPPITLRHLMTHRSGLPREPQLVDPYSLQHEVSEAEFLASLSKTHLESSPGTTESYSNLGAALEGLVIARVSGRPYAVYMHDQLLGPLGMPTATFDRGQIPPTVRASSYTRGADGVLKPAPLMREAATAARGQLYTTVGELAQFASVELLAWPPRDDTETGPVRRSTLRESQRTEGPSPPGSHTKGAGWFLEATPRGLIVEHGGVGEGFVSDMWLSTTANVAFVVMTNVEDLALLAVARQAQSILLPDPLALVAALLDDTSDANAERLVEPAYLQAMRARGSLAAFTKLRAETGPCVAAKFVSDAATSSDGATAGTIKCGSIRLRVSASASAAGRISFVLIEGRESEP